LTLNTGRAENFIIMTHMKMQDKKLTDQMTGNEIAGKENLFD